jgi:hypothetical protein
MRGRFLAVLVLGCVGLAAAAGAANFSGTLYAEGDAYPDLGVGGGVVLTLESEGWWVKNTTTFDAWPDIADSQTLEIERALGDLRLLTAAGLSFTAATFGLLDVALSGDVWTAGLPAADPQAEVTCTAGAGVTIGGGVDSYEFFDTTLAVGDHWITHSVAFYANPAGVESYIDAFASVFQTTIGEGDSAISVSLAAFAETYVLSLEFSYATLKAKVGLGCASLTGIVAYYGGSDVTVTLRLGVNFGPIAIGE